MKEFDDFDTQAMRTRAVSQVLIRRGGFHVYRPNDAEMEREVSEQVDVTLEVLRQYHEWLSDAK